MMLQQRGNVQEGKHSEMMSVQRNLGGNGEFQLITLNLASNAVHVLDEVVGAAVGDFGALVGGAERDDGSAAGNAGADARGRVLEDDTLRGFVSETLGSEEEWVRRRLAGLEALIVCGDGDGRRCDTNASHASVSCIWREHLL